MGLGCYVSGRNARRSGLYRRWSIAALGVAQIRITVEGERLADSEIIARSTTALEGVCATTRQRYRRRRGVGGGGGKRQGGSRLCTDGCFARVL